MLNSLTINKYRNLKSLNINSLGRVNLITGKNNTGKSSILEAIAIYASKGDLSLLYQILSERGDRIKKGNDRASINDANIKSLSSLFTNRVTEFNKENRIIIGSLENTLFGKEIFEDDSISFRFVKFFDEIQRDLQGSIISSKRIIWDEYSDNNFPSENYKIGFEVRKGNNFQIYSLESDSPILYGSRRNIASENYQFIRTRNIDRETNGNLWDLITLTDKEKYVIDALKIIEVDAERIAFIGDNSRERTAVVKLSSFNHPLPLRSMGDGINRILTIILALVNSDNGFLLIDEFENGLHYTVQEQLWNLIFKLSQKLNVQVFATTHSQDCIYSFESVLNKSENLVKGKLIRVDNYNGDIKQVEFDERELKIAAENNIETR